MRKPLIATVSALALLASGAALANERTAEPWTLQLAAGAADDSGAASMGGSTEGMDETYGSYTNFDGTFEGEISGGYNDQDLVGSRVSGPQGEDYGEIHDMMYDRENRVDLIIIDVADFNQDSTERDRYRAMRIDQLEREQGAGGEFSTVLTASEIQALPSYYYMDEDGQWRINTN